MGLIRAFVVKPIKNMAEDIADTAIATVVIGAVGVVGAAAIAVGEVVGGAAEVCGAAVNGIGKAVDATKSGIEKSQAKDANKFLQIIDTHKRFVIFSKKSSPNDLDVYDSSGEIKFKIKKAYSEEERIALFAANGTHIACIFKKSSSGILSAFDKTPTENTLLVGGKRIGSVGIIDNKLKKSIVPHYKNWTANGNLEESGKFFISAGETLIMDLEYKKKLGGYAYYLDVTNASDEIACLLFTALLDLVIHKK